MCSIHSNYGQLRMQLQNHHIIQLTVSFHYWQGLLIFRIQYSKLSLFLVSLRRCFKRYFQKLNFAASGHNIFIFRVFFVEKIIIFEEYVCKHFNKAKAYH